MPKQNDLPLFQHRNGQWARNIRGKFHYFGTDKDKALARWTDEKDYLLAGKLPPKRATGATVVELANLFFEGCRKRVEAGELSERSRSDYKETLDRLIASVGRGCRPESLGPMEFADIKEKLFEPVERSTPIRGGIRGLVVDRRAATTVAGDVRRIRAFLNWCANNELIPAPRFGTGFSPISVKSQRRQGARKQRRDLSPDEIRLIIDASSRTFKPLVLMGINAGLGNRDLCEMRLNDLPELTSGEVWVDLPRGKTGADRRFLLWPETVAAIRDYLDHRPTAAGPSNIQRLFLTKYGQAWVRESNGDRKDAIAGAFTRFRKAAEVDRGTFYDLRRTFQTIAEQTLDFPAVSFVMGHAPKSNDMSATYRQFISDDRLRSACQHVRSWLFKPAAAKKSAKAS